MAHGACIKQIGSLRKAGVQIIIGCRVEFARMLQLHSQEPGTRASFVNLLATVDIAGPLHDPRAGGGTAAVFEASAMQ